MPSRFSGLSFRIISANILALIIAFFVAFWAIDAYIYRTWLDRLDRALETEILLLTSTLDLNEDQPMSDQLRPHLQRFSRAYGIAQAFLRALDEDGNQLAASDLSHFRGFDHYQLPMDQIALKPFYWETAPLSSHGTRIIHYYMPEGFILQFGYDMWEVHQQRSQARLIFALGMAAVLIITSFLAYLGTHRALRGIRLVTDAAHTIRKDASLDYRVPVFTGSHETDVLAATFNRMLERIQGLMTHLRDMMDNVAHDLKTPVTRMRMAAENQLAQPSATPLDFAGGVVEECDRILNLVNVILEITATETGLVHRYLQPVDLPELVEEACDLFQPVFENKALSCTLQLENVPSIRSDARALQRVIANLLDNAIKFTPAGGTVSCRVSCPNGHVRLEVNDTGIGIDQDQIHLIFERFHRADHSRVQPGNGLGLCFCKVTVESLGGTIHCQSRPGQGSTFTVCLPLGPDAGNARVASTGSADA